MQIHISTFLILTIITKTIHSQSDTNLSREDTLNAEIAYQSEDQSFFSTPIFIGIAVLLGFNFLVFLLVYGLRICIRRVYHVELNSQRQKYGERHPHLTFETSPYCLVDGQKFKSIECYQFGEVMSKLPAFIYGREIEPETSHLDYLTIKQCDRCGGMTQTLQIFKYGKLRQFWSTMFMILISPCFLAFTIRMLGSNNILWRKFFCTQCGFEKPSTH